MLIQANISEQSGNTSTRSPSFEHIMMSIRY